MAVRLAITAAILFYLSTRIDMAASARAIAAVNLTYLAAVLGLVALDRCVMILRWVLLLRGSGVPIAWSEAARIFLVSSFVGSFLPAGVGADAARAYGLAQQTARGSEALASVAVDRLLGILALVAMGVAGLVLWSPARATTGESSPRSRPWPAASVSVFWADGLIRWLVPDHRHDGAVTRRVLRTTDAVSRYRDRRGVLVHVMAWSIAVQLLRITQAYVLALGLGLAVPYAYFLLVMPLGPVDAPAAPVDQRVRTAPGRLRLAAAADGGARYAGFRPLHPDRPDRPGGEPPGPAALADGTPRGVPFPKTVKSCRILYLAWLRSTQRSILPRRR